MKRLYHKLIKEHFASLRQMVFLAGPRQVGKTTTSFLVGKEEQEFFYFNWDEAEARSPIISGPKVLAETIDLAEMRKKSPIIIFDEIYKYSKWKQFLKGFFDIFGEVCHILVMGSAKLNIYKRMGDSLMGRYFLYRIHPLSVGELLCPDIQETLIQPPKKLAPKKYEQLLSFGGFPEPFLKANHRFSTNWKRMRQEQLIMEDIRDLSQIQDLARLDLLSTVLRDYSGQLVSKTNLANLVNVSVPTITRWLSTLESFYYCFHIRPWTKNITRSLRKEPKHYLWDWTLAQTEGSCHENCVASHLLKAVHFWTDYGLGEFELFFLRDKEQREVDFLVTKDGEPWFLVEVISSKANGLSKALYHYQALTKAPHAFQVTFGLPFVDKDCFSYKQPVIVPASTFLSQLI